MMSKPPKQLQGDADHVQRELFEIIDDESSADNAYDRIEVYDDNDKTIVLANTYGGRVIGTDLARFLHRAYHTYEGRWRYTEATSRPASKYATKRLSRDITNFPAKELEHPNPVILFNAGGVASGKSHSISEEELNVYSLISDGQMKTPAKAILEIELALSKGWDVAIHYTHRPFNLVVRGAIRRAILTGRWGPLKELPLLHIDAQRSVLEVAGQFSSEPQVKVDVFMNSGTPEDPKPVEVISISRLAEGGDLRYNDIEELRKMLEDEISKTKEEGKWDSEKLEILISGSFPY